MKIKQPKTIITSSVHSGQVKSTAPIEPCSTCIDCAKAKKRRKSDTTRNPSIPTETRKHRFIIDSWILVSLFPAQKAEMTYALTIERNTVSEVKKLDITEAVMSAISYSVIPIYPLFVQRFVDTHNETA